MNRQQKVSFAVLLLLAVLFAVGIGLGTRGGGEAPELAEFPPPWLGNLGDLFVRKKKIDVTRLDAPCLEDRVFFLSPAGSCEVAIPPAEVAVRRAVLELRRGRAARLKFVPAGDRALPVEVVLRPGAQDENPSDVLELDVFEPGGTLVLTCEKGASEEDAGCQVEIH